MTNIQLSKKLGKLVDFKENLREYVTSGVHTGTLTGDYTMIFEGGTFTIDYIQGNRPVRGQTLGEALRKMHWTIKSAMKSGRGIKNLTLSK